MSGFPALGWQGQYHGTWLSKITFIYVFEYILPVCMPGDHLHPVPTEVRRGIRSPGT